MTKVQPIEDLFEALIELPTADQRRDYLDKVCGDDAELRQRLEELFRSHEQAGSFLQDDESLDETRDLGQRNAAGETIGPYKLREMIGEGGMGSVYVAEQTKPLRRKVALKVIKPGMDSKSVIGRFEAERNALAMMNHPNIAKVLDAGETDQGRPYFVMELVNGVPITQYCDEQRLSIRQRLELFSDVCQAIQHAHQKGIIHRDIKPSNVMVTELDGKPIAKVIDFGVAKALNQSLTEHSLYTAFQTVIGTPLYMSPEQASFSAVDVDTRSDVYSLGVLLYELLTGTTPFTSDDLKQAAQDEVFRFIRESEPPRPSNRISSLGDTATRVSQLRHTQPDQLGRTVKGDLDWIVMKALAKERGRRYKTADALADDVGRHLSDQPIEARAPTIHYRLSRFYRRNRSGVIALGIASVLVAILVIHAGRSMITEAAIAQKYRGGLFETTMLKLLSGDPDPHQLIEEAILSELSDDRINLLRAQAALYSGYPEDARNYANNVLQHDSENVPANAMLALSYYHSGDLWKGVSQRDKASALEPREPLDHLFLASIAFGVDPKGEEHIQAYLDQQNTALGLAVRANLRAWRLTYGEPKIETDQAFDDLHAARTLLGPTAYVLQTELALNTQVFRISIESGLPNEQYLIQAKVTEAELAHRFPDYFWGNFLRGSLWYSQRDFAKAADVWGEGSNDWNNANIAIARLRNGDVQQARMRAEQIKTPMWTLVCFPILKNYDLGRKRLRDAHKKVLKLAENKTVYREPFTLLIPYFLGEPRESIREQARRWLKTWGSDDDEDSWAAWNHDAVRYFAGKWSKQDLIDEAGGNGARVLGIHLYFGLSLLAQDQKEAAKNEFAQGFDPEWETTFLGSMWSACLLEELEETSDAANTNGREIADNLLAE